MKPQNERGGAVENDLPTPNEFCRTHDTPNAPTGQTESIGSDRQREGYRLAITRHWRSNGHRCWTAGQLERAVDAAILNGRKRTAQRPAAKPSTDGTEPPQAMLFGDTDVARRTRAKACRDAQRAATPRQRQILDFVSSCGPRGAIREEIADGASIPIQSVCPAVAALIDAGRLIEDGRERATRSGKAAAVVVVKAGVVS